MKKKSNRKEKAASKIKEKKAKPSINNSNSSKKKKENESKTKKVNLEKIDKYSDKTKDELKKIYENLINKKFEDKPKYVNIVSSPHINDSDMEVLDKLSTITKFNLITPIEILYKEHYESFHKISNEKDKCSICQYVFYEKEEENNNKDDDKKDDKINTFENYLEETINVVLLDKCTDHFFHIECLSLLIGDKDNFRCPNCSMIYGILIGDMPYGTMTAYISKNTHCDGYKKNGTIIINYYFPDGDTYSGTIRECYLPDTKEGREILGLLKVAFDRKLSFTIGTSVTTGQTNTTVWNGIHHKTNIRGGPTRFGYPDPTYFNRVQEELAVKGVSKSNIDEDLEDIAQELIDNS